MRSWWTSPVIASLPRSDPKRDSLSRDPFASMSVFSLVTAYSVAFLISAAYGFHFYLPYLTTSCRLEFKTSSTLSCSITLCSQMYISQSQLANSYQLKLSVTNSERLPAVVYSVGDQGATLLIRNSSYTLFNLRSKHW